MRALRVVGLTEDGDVVLEDPVRLERYTVPADERLRAAARGDLSRLGQIAIELESQLRPREIQARIRAGASVEQVATAAGVPEQKIERFAYPVLTERFRTADNAQRAHPMRADGPDNRTLAEVVAHTLGLRGQTYEGAKWDSWKGEDGRWVVALSWRAGRSDNRAHWVFQPGAHGGTVTALDEHASDLVEGLPARPLRTVGAVVDMTRPEEEPPPAHSPVEQWRAAASDSFREQRLPIAPDAGRRTPSEPWRPAPSQRQAEPPVDPRSGRPDPYRQAESLADPRPAAYRPTEPLADPRPADRPETYRPAEPLADPRPARPESYQPEAYPPAERAAGYRPPDTRVPGPRPDTPRHEQPTERRGNGIRTSGEWAPWERGVTRTAAPPAPGGDVTVPAARTAPDEPAADIATPPLAAPVIPAPSAEKDPVVEPNAAAVDAAEAPAAVIADAPAPAEPEEAVAVPALDEAAAAEQSPAEPTPTEPPAPEATAAEPTAAQEADAAAQSEPAAAEPYGSEPSGAAAPAEPYGSESSETGAAAEPSATEPSGAATAATDADASDVPATAPPADEGASADVAGAKAPTTGAPARRTRKGKPVMPSWDEVLLGVRGPR